MVAFTAINDMFRVQLWFYKPTQECTFPLSHMIYIMSNIHRDCHSLGDEMHDLTVHFIYSNDDDAHKLHISLSSNAIYRFILSR
jgi:hypothetical protein